MNTFDYLWQLLDPGNAYTSQKDTCRRMWSALPLQRQRIIYATIRDKQLHGDKVHPNPKFALEDNLNAQPEFLTGAEVEMCWDEGTPVVQVLYGRLHKLCTLEQAQRFGLEIEHPFNRLNS